MDATQPSARDFACMVALEGGRLLVHGGLDATERRLDDTWIFDTVTYVNLPTVQPGLCITTSLHFWVTSCQHTAL